ncbi:glycoside hydrolase family 10 protein [Porphyromonas sp.]|uniref:glycoside hydrolase family 10 protein n=1 Tax=Porphyromonas sp. TaxID=1924944 RepID=UPI0026DACDD0|nr:family 10 glycosylhydrolase [Porphyromonas sp.]MDO4695170.1 family 10 glycosylhydrolase [Porphyromonas sp.]MDO4770916.1 family 10 glycosylhydrolase [Porphyromonas sp.]
MRKFIILGLLAISALFYRSIACASAGLQVDSLTAKKYEVRAVWLTTIFNLDWPKKPAQTLNDEKRQQKELSAFLDRLYNAGINTVYLQVRGRGDLIYPSSIEPISPAIKGKSLNALSYDPLQYAIDECHKRGMRVHAWLVTLPLGTSSYIKTLGHNAYVKMYPGHCLRYKGEWYMDPSSEHTIRHLKKIVRELVSRYEIDGIQLDYIRYPSNKEDFPDKLAYAKSGTSLSKEEWRKSNINRIVSGIYEQVKELRPEIEVSASPLGKYREVKALGEVGWTALESVHQDPLQWEKDTKIDALAPMLYYKENLFYPFVEDWINLFKTPIIVGLGSYRLMRGEGDWKLYEILAQVRYVQQHQKTSGIAFFRADQVASPTFGLYEQLKDSLFARPTLPFKGDSLLIGNKPSEIEVREEKEGLRMSWRYEVSAGDKVMYVVYISPTGEVNPNQAGHMVARSLTNEVLIPWAHIPQDTLITFTVSVYNVRNGQEAVSTEKHAYYRTSTQK